jgi:hypothetical protein
LSISSTYHDYAPIKYEKKEINHFPSFNINDVFEYLDPDAIDPKNPQAVQKFFKDIYHNVY